MSTLQTALHILNDARSHRAAHGELPARAVALAESLTQLALAYATPSTRAHDAQLARMLEDPQGKAFTVAMADRVFREPTENAAATALHELVGELGAPSYLAPFDRLALTAGAIAARFVPSLVVRAARAKFLEETSKVILPAEATQLSIHITQRAAQGVRLNLNQLGEAILGEEEAQARMNANLELLRRADVNYISVKISSVFSQVNTLAFDQTVTAVCKRLRVLYRAAQQSAEPKFVNLDMEEFRDLAITVEAFERVLLEPEFLQLQAGIVLQAYLPDSAHFQVRLCNWACTRAALGGARIKVRIVKGANLAMERVESELHHWAQAPYATKAEVDANYKRMLAFGLRAENAAVVRLGVASHNVFDLSYALLLSAHHDAEAAVDIEMLEGMAEAMSGALCAVKGNVLLYAPVVSAENFGSAVAYLVRRLDENTSPENYLRHSFSMTPGTPAWADQSARFVAAAEAAHSPPDPSRRTQNRGCEDTATKTHFENSTDTDWTQPANRTWLATHLTVPQPARGSIPHCTEAGFSTTLNEVRTCVQIARNAVAAWNARGVKGRAALLLQAATVLERRRGEAIAVMAREANKAPYEGDVEVSEAVDFASYYAHALDEFEPAGKAHELHHEPLGVVVVAPPWNFPYAIPAGGVLAALMAGNAVVLKPAPEVVATSWLLANCLWDAGIPRDVLQFLPCPDNEVGRELVAGAGTDAVILTGAHETAAMFQGWKPELRLFAETSGKNGILISSHADTDLAVKDLVKSAFGHAGQKCSAASVAYVHKDIFDSPAFLRQLKDAAASLHVAGSSDLSAVVTPLVKAPEAFLQSTLTTLGEGESWFLKPELVDDHCDLWSPGIKLIAAGSEAHTREWFGPVLGVMRVESFEDGLHAQNATPFGLTAGLHSLDRREIAAWCQDVQAGNLYVNRPITGAIVQRQPFGGWKRSSVGPGAKAGGPNYVARLCTWTRPARATNAHMTHDYAQTHRSHFSQHHDASNLGCETNVFRYRRLRGTLLAIAGDAHEAHLMRKGAEVANVRSLHVLVAPSDAELEAWADRIAHGEVERVWTAIALSAAALQVVNACPSVLHAKPTGVGRLDLLAYYNEQSVSVTAHRYGNLGAMWP